MSIASTGAATAAAKAPLPPNPLTVCQADLKLINSCLSDENKTKFVANCEAAIKMNPDFFGKLNAKAVSVIQTMALDHQNRMTHAIGDPLKKGFFDPFVYFQELEKRGERAEKHVQKMFEDRTFYKGKAPSSSFEMIPNERDVAGCFPMHYRIKKGVKVSQALKDLWKTVVFVRTGEACQIALSRALQELLGEEKFDALFGLNAEFPLFFGTDDDQSIYNPLYQLLVPTFREDFRKVKFGEMVCFKGAANCAKKHFLNRGRSLNVICIEEGNDPKFVGLGLDPKGVTKAQIAEILRGQFNAKPMKMDKMFDAKILSTVVKEADHKFDCEISAAAFASEGGGEMIDAMQFDMKKIAILKALNVEQACKQLNKWQVQCIRAYKNLLSATEK
jgi:hypothetical protein